MSTTIALMEADSKHTIFYLPFQHNFRSMHIPTKRDTSTIGTITAMSKVCVVFFFLLEQYVSLIFEHAGLPSNLVTHLNNV